MINRGFLIADDHIAVDNPDLYILNGYLKEGASLHVRAGLGTVHADVEYLSEHVKKAFGGLPVRVTVRLSDLPKSGRLFIFSSEGGRMHLGFDRSVTEIRKKACGIQYSIDLYRVQPEKETVQIQGWAVGKGIVELSAVDEYGEPYKAEIQRYARYDAAEIFQEYPVALNCGFLVKITPIPEGRIILRMKCGKSHAAVALPASPWYEKGMKAARLVKKGRDTLLYQGAVPVVRKIYDKWFNPNTAPTDYNGWFHKNEPSKKELEEQRKTGFPYEPKISVVIPLYNTPDDLLRTVVDDIMGQTYGNVELCLADGSTGNGPEEFIKAHYADEPRIVYKKLEKNLGISGNTNEAVKLATGDFIMLSDHDDSITPDACFEIVKAINSAPDVDVVYTDEDKISEFGDVLFDPHFKPDFNLDLLRSNNYICHIFVVRASVLQEAGLFRSEYDGAQDYDFILRCCEKARTIKHVPKVLYHWRTIEGSTAGNPESKLYAYENGRKAIQAHYDRLHLPAEASMTEYWGRYRSIFRVQGEPLVSIIIPNKDHAADLKRCISSVEKLTEYKNYEILVVENGSTDPEILNYYAELREKHENVRILEWTKPFNYAAINNFAAKEANGEFLLFLNNDIEVIQGDWLTEMLGYCQRDDVGAVGAKLDYPDGTIQHVGIILGMGGAAGHMFYGWGTKDFTYSGRGNSTQDLSAVTAACMITKKKLFEEAGGFDESFTIAFNDVDYCLKLREMGYLVVINVYAELIHYESATRGSDKKKEDEARHARFLAEADHMRSKWKKWYDAGDPAFNPNLELSRPDFAWKGQFEVENHEEE